MARQEKKYHYIYKIRCKVTNKYYIGMHSTDNLNDGYFGSGKRLWFSINYHGKENHTKEILEWLSSRQLLKEREKEIVNKELLGDKLCMNLREGGDGFDSEEAKVGREKCDKILEQKYGKNFKSVIIKNYHNSLNEKEKEIMSNKIKTGQKLINFNYSQFKNKTHSDNTKKLIGKKNSIKQQGSNNSQYGSCWITNEVKNKKINKGDLIPEGWKLGRKIK